MSKEQRFPALLVVGGLTGVLAFAPAPAMAEIYNFVDDNSTLTIDNGVSMFQWTVDGVQYMFEQRFLYRIGPSGGESFLDTLDISGVPIVLGNGVLLTLSGPGFEAEILFGLDGGAPGSGKADLFETINITNTGASALDFHIFQYVDFDMDGEGASGNDSLVFPDGGHVEQWGLGGNVSESMGAGSPPDGQPDGHHGGPYGPLWTDLTDGSPTMLDDLPGINTEIGPDDLAWAFQWDQEIVAGGSFTIVKGKSIQVVPAPGAVVLVMMGLGLVGWVHRRRLS